MYCYLPLLCFSIFGSYIQNKLIMVYFIQLTLFFKISAAGRFIPVGDRNVQTISARYICHTKGDVHLYTSTPGIANPWPQASWIVALSCSKESLWWNFFHSLP